MQWLLKYYSKSKYFGFKRLNYKEFELFSDLLSFINVYKIEDYEIYESAGII